MLTEWALDVYAGILKDAQLSEYCVEIVGGVGSAKPDDKIPPDPEDTNSITGATGNLGFKNFI